MHQSSPHFDIDSPRSTRTVVSSGPAAATAVKSRDVAGKSDSTLFSQRTNSLLGVQILATGSYVPDNVVTNDDLKDIRGFDPEWVEQRTGIYERRHAPAGMDTSDLAVNAARRAIEQSGVDPRDIDLLVVGRVGDQDPAL